MQIPALLFAQSRFCVKRLRHLRGVDFVHLCVFNALLLTPVRACKTKAKHKKYRYENSQWLVIGMLIFAIADYSFSLAANALKFRNNLYFISCRLVLLYSVSYLC